MDTPSDEPLGYPALRSGATDLISLAAMKVSFFAALALCFAATGCTNISCDYGPPDPQEKLPSDLEVGTILRTQAAMIGLIDESIDDAKVHYLNVVAPPGYHNRFVKFRVDIPAGSSFRIQGYRRPHSMLCGSYEWEAVLVPGVKLTPDGDEVHMMFSVARDGKLISRRSGG